MHLVLTQPQTALREIRARLQKEKGVILLLVPEVSLVQYFGRELQSFSPVLVHSGLKKREQRTVQQAIRESAAHLIIGTRTALFLPWQKLSQIIVEDPLHEAYKSDMTPRYAAVDAARELARIHDALLLFLSPALSTANQYLVDKKVLTLEDQKPFWPRITMVDMVQEQLQGNPSLFSRQAQDIILDAHADGRTVLLFSPRRAYTTSVRCQHCHRAHMCPTCSIPMRLHRTSEDMLICYRCAAYIQVPKQCTLCHAGTLKPAGLAGSQKIAQVVSDLLDRHGLKHENIPILDSDLGRVDVNSQFVVATQMIFGYRYEKSFDQVIVIGADALAYNPDFRTQERLIYQLEKIADLKPKTLLIQYWDAQGALMHAPDRSWDDFYRQELSDRQTLNWPPFCRLVKMTYAHRSAAAVGQAARTAVDRLRRAVEYLRIGKTTKILGPTPDHAIILKTTSDARRLQELLSYVPTGWTIDIDPRSIT